MHKQPRLITFEGGEGAGKSTQVRRLAAYLQETGYTVVCTKEPGGTDYGQQIRRIILTPATGIPLSPRAELFLYVADRAHHVDTVIQPALAAGHIVLCDRYADSTVAYQGYGRQLDLDLVYELNRLATAGLQPDITFWFDLEPRLGLERVGRRAPSDRLESEALAFHERLRQGYQELAAQYPQRWIRIDAAGSEDAVFQQLKEKWQIYGTNP